MNIKKIKYPHFVFVFLILVKSLKPLKIVNKRNIQNSTATMETIPKMVNLILEIGSLG